MEPWQGRQNPDWTTGFMDEEKKELDAYCAMLKDNPRAMTPGRTEDDSEVKFRKGTTMAVPKRGGGGRFSEACFKDTTIMALEQGQSVREAMGSMRVKSRQRSRAGSRQRRRPAKPAPENFLAGLPMPRKEFVRARKHSEPVVPQAPQDAEAPPDAEERVKRMERLQRLAARREATEKALQKKKRRPAGGPPPKKKAVEPPPTASKVKQIKAFFGVEGEEEAPATAERATTPATPSKRVSFDPDTDFDPAPRPVTRESKARAQQKSNVRTPSPRLKRAEPLTRPDAFQGGSWKFSDVSPVEPTPEKSPEQPMPRIVMPTVGQRCGKIDYDEVFAVQEALDVRRNLSVRERLQGRVVRDPQLVAKPKPEPPVNDFTEALRKEVVRTRVAQLQELEDALDAAEAKPAPVKAIEPETARRLKARDRDTSCPACRCATRGKTPTYAHTCAKGLALAAGDLGDSSEESVEAMDIYERLGDAEGPEDFERTLLQARARALEEENETEERIETLEELAREHVSDSLAVMEYRYELRQLTKGGTLSGLISKPRAYVERQVAKAVLGGSPAGLRTALVALALFPPVSDRASKVEAAAQTLRAFAQTFTGRVAGDAPDWLAEKLEAIRASSDETEPLVVTCINLCLVARKMELRARVKDGAKDDRGDAKLIPQGVSKKREAEDGSSRAHAACFQALINAGADANQWDGSGLGPLHHACQTGDAGCVRFLASLGADCDQFVCDEKRLRPLHLAAAVSCRKRSLRTCIALLEHGADVRCVDWEGQTCLHVAGERGPRGLVELLMDAGAPRAADAKGRSPADAAEAAGQTKLAAVIRGYRDPVKRVGGSIGISKRLEFLETGQLDLGLGEEKPVDSLRASAKKFRKDIFASLGEAKKYKSGMKKPKRPPRPPARMKKFVPAKAPVVRLTEAEKRVRADAKKARNAHRRRLAAAPSLLDAPALMDAPSPIMDPRRTSASSFAAGECRALFAPGGDPSPPLPPIRVDPAAEERKRKALRKAKKAAAAVARLNSRRALKFKKPDPRVAAPGGNLSRKLALNLSNLPAPTAQIRGRTPLKRVTFSRESSAGPRGSFEVRAWTPTSR